MKISFATTSLPDTGAVVVGVLEGGHLTPAAAALDQTCGGAIHRAVKAAKKFSGKRDQSMTLIAPHGCGYSQVVLYGLGKPKDLDTLKLQAIGGTVQAALTSSGETACAILLDGLTDCSLGDASVAANLAFGARLRSYRFDRYLTKEKKEDKPSLKKFTVHTGDVKGAKHTFETLDKIADGVFLTRDLVSEPANVLYPESFAKRCLSLTELGVEVQVLDEKQMKKLGMGALLGVAQGSENKPRLVVLRWNGAKDKDAKPLAFIGKGVCFDSGGISIKPSAGMEDMKWDMGGAGVVTGLMTVLAGRKAKVNAIGVLGLVENMPSGAAQRPGDIVTSLSGQTIEVLNTDAEGRLVLADALWYAKETFQPEVMIDLATLTGAIIICLGGEYAGLFSNDDALATRLSLAGKAVGEELWRMPMGPAYDKQLNSQAADMKNIGGREGGSITAAQFLKRFVGEVKWAHLDIAGVTWSKSDSPTVPKGGTAFGVRLLDRYVAEHWEK